MSTENVIAFDPQCPAGTKSAAEEPVPFNLVAIMILATSAILVSPALTFPATRARAQAADCRIGTYRLSDGNDVDVGPVAEGRLRWRRKDGTTGELTRASGDEWTSTLGWTKRRDGTRVTFDCGRDSIDFAGTTGTRIAFDVAETRFSGAGVELAGRLIIPMGKGKVPIVVLVHGSRGR
jgi:hypothetical protein